MTPTAQQIQPNAPNRAASPKERGQIAGICLFLAAITFAVFGQTAWFNFINFDDNEYVYTNPVVSKGLTGHGFAWAFDGAHASNWHPLTWLSHMLDCQLYGLHPAGHHLTNVLLHAATVIALFLILRQMTGALWKSALVAAIFAIHPLRAESVAWVAERKDVLSGLFFVLTIGAYVRFARQPKSPMRYGLVLLLFALGLMSKPMLVTLPVILVLLDFWPLTQRQTPRRLTRTILPLLVLSAAVCVITIISQHGAIEPTKSLPISSRLANAVVTAVIYLWQMVWPANLSVFYPHPRDGIPVWKTALAGALLVALSILAWRQRGKRPWLIVGWAWYLVMLLPVVGIIQVGGQAHADRYTYLPQIGICLAATWAAVELAEKWRFSRTVSAGLAAAVIALLAVGAARQTTYWKNSGTLWQHALDCTSDNVLAHANLANYYVDNREYDAAIAECRIALKIAPADARTHSNLGSTLLEQGKVDEATTNLMYALAIDPADAAAHLNLGRALVLKGKTDEALAHFLKAVQLKPDYAEAHYHLAKLYLDHGRTDDAIAHFQAALENGSDYAEIRTALGNALLKEGRTPDAAAQFEQALKIDPHYAQADYNLGNILLGAGDVDGAIAHYRHAVQTDPAYAQAHVNLGDALMEKGKLDEALTQFLQALKIDPNFATAHVNLGDLLLQRGRVDDAIPHFERALQIKPSFAEAHSGLADAFQQKGKIAESMTHLRQAAQLQPNNPENLNNLAWLLATAHDASLRNGTKAVEAAMKANQLTGGRNPAVLRTLAAAFAEAGRFEDARRAAQGALQLLQGSGQGNLAAELGAELKSYEQGIPWHQK